MRVPGYTYGTTCDAVDEGCGSQNGEAAKRRADPPKKCLLPGHSAVSLGCTTSLSAVRIPQVSIQQLLFDVSESCQPIQDKDSKQPYPSLLLIFPSKTHWRL